MAIPQFKGWGVSINATRVSDEVSTILLYSRTKAIAINGCYKVFFDTTNNSYSAYSDKHCDGTFVLDRTMTMGDYNIKFGCNTTLGSNYPSGSCPTNGLTFTGGKVIFNPKGEADSSGYIYLIPTADVGKNNSNMKAIEVNALTGRVRRHSCCWD
jgi:Tfp pilus assembly protein FimT